MRDHRSAAETAHACFSDSVVGRLGTALRGLTTLASVCSFCLLSQPQTSYHCDPSSLMPLEVAPVVLLGPLRSNNVILSQADVFLQRCSIAHRLHGTSHRFLSGSLQGALQISGLFKNIAKDIRTSERIALGPFCALVKKRGKSFISEHPRSFSCGHKGANVSVSIYLRNSAALGNDTIAFQKQPVTDPPGK